MKLSSLLEARIFISILLPLSLKDTTPLSHETPMHHSVSGPYITNQSIFSI